MENKNNFRSAVIVLVLVIIFVSVYAVYTNVPVTVPDEIVSPPSADNPALLPPMLITPALTEPTRVELSLYEKRQFGELAITPWAVLEDSRCPSDVQCIQAGRVVVAFNLSGPSGDSTLQLETGQTGSTENLQLALHEVRPYPVSTRKIQDDEYRFIITISPKRPAGAVACYVGGCSSQLCTDEANAVSTCEFREAYACYQNATCERQENGECGWTSTPALAQCLSAAR